MGDPPKRTESTVDEQSIRINKYSLNIIYTKNSLRLHLQVIKFVKTSRF